MMVRIFCFAVLTLSLSGLVKCKDLIGNREVQYQRTPQNWFTASEICRSTGMQMLTLRTEEETDQIYELAKKYKPRSSFWVAATDLGREGDFVWSTTGMKLTTARWSVNQPDNNGDQEHCVEITYRWNDTVPVWNDVPCNHNYPYFCEATSTVNPTVLCFNP